MFHEIYNQSVGYRFAIHTARYTTKLQKIFERSSYTAKYIAKTFTRLKIN